MASQVRGHSTPAGTIQPRPNRLTQRVGIVMLVLSALFFAVNFGQAWWTSMQYKHEVTQLQSQIASAKRLNAQLQSQIPYYTSKNYIVARARSSYGMIHPGDTVLYIKQLPPHVKTVYKRAPAPEPATSPFVRLLRAIFH